MITLMRTEELVNQMPAFWQGVYTWLKENCRDVDLVIHEGGGTVYFEGEIKVYTRSGPTIFVNFPIEGVFGVAEDGEVFVVSEAAPELTDQTILELNRPDFFDQLNAIVNAEEDED
jgi:hypothetical protein